MRTQNKHEKSSFAHPVKKKKNYSNSNIKKGMCKKILLQIIGIVSDFVSKIVLFGINRITLKKIELQFHHAVYWPRTGRKSAEIRRSSSAQQDTTFFNRPVRYDVLQPGDEIRRCSAQPSI